MISNLFKCWAFKYIAVAVIVAFVSMIPLETGYAQVMPRPGQMVHESAPFTPTLMMGLRVDLTNPFNLSFVMSNGEKVLPEDAKKDEYTKLIKYFMASLITPNTDMWVNLSPKEADRIIPDNFSMTEMGRDLLAQDYLLKQFTASLMYPEDQVGREFWKKIYEKAYQTYGTTDIPIDTFNKVWITADKADIYQKGDTAFLVDSHLKVMLEQDFMAVDGNKAQFSGVVTADNGADAESRKMASGIVREVIVPIIEKEVNEGANFAGVRQAYHSMILATWFKKTLKNSLLGQVYADKSKVAGIALNDPQAKDEIYQQYLAAYKTGVFNYIKEEFDTLSQETLPRKYFAGGMVAVNQAMINTNVTAWDAARAIARIPGSLDMAQVTLKSSDGRDIVPQAKVPAAVQKAVVKPVARKAVAAPAPRDNREIIDLQGKLGDAQAATQKALAGLVAAERVVRQRTRAVEEAAAATAAASAASSQDSAQVSSGWRKFFLILAVLVNLLPSISSAVPFINGFGQQQTVAVNAPVSQVFTGMASFYSPDEGGKSNTIGGRDNELVPGISAAVNERLGIPLGSWLAVYDQQTGMLIGVVRADDHGPYEKNAQGKWVPHSKRIIDLHVSSQSIYAKSGLLNVRVEVLGQNYKPAAAEVAKPEASPTENVATTSSAVSVGVMLDRWTGIGSEARNFDGFRLVGENDPLIGRRLWFGQGSTSQLVTIKEGMYVRQEQAPQALPDGVHPEDGKVLTAVITPTQSAPQVADNEPVFTDEEVKALQGDAPEVNVSAGDVDSKAIAQRQAELDSNKTALEKLQEQRQNLVTARTRLAADLEDLQTLSKGGIKDPELYKKRVQAIAQQAAKAQADVEKLRETVKQALEASPIEKKDEILTLYIRVETQALEALSGLASTGGLQFGIGVGGKAQPYVKAGEVVYGLASGAVTTAGGYAIGALAILDATIDIIQQPNFQLLSEVGGVLSPDWEKDFYGLRLGFFKVGVEEGKGFVLNGDKKHSIGVALGDAVAAAIGVNTDRTVWGIPTLHVDTKALGFKILETEWGMLRFNDRIDTKAQTITPLGEKQYLNFTIPGEDIGRYVKSIGSRIAGHEALPKGASIVVYSLDQRAAYLEAIANTDPRIKYFIERKGVVQNIYRNDSVTGKKVLLSTAKMYYAKADVAANGFETQSFLEATKGWEENSGSMREIHGLGNLSKLAPQAMKMTTGFGGETGFVNNEQIVYRSYEDAPTAFKLTRAPVFDKENNIFVYEGGKPKMTSANLPSDEKVPVNPWTGNIVQNGYLSAFLEQKFHDEGAGDYTVPGMNQKIHVPQVIIRTFRDQSPRTVMVDGQNMKLMSGLPVKVLKKGEEIRINMGTNLDDIVIGEGAAVTYAEPLAVRVKDAQGKTVLLPAIIEYAKAKSPSAYGMTIDGKTGEVKPVDVQPAGSLVAQKFDQAGWEALLKSKAPAPTVAEAMQVLGIDVSKKGLQEARAELKKLSAQQGATLKQRKVVKELDDILSVYSGMGPQETEQSAYVGVHIPPALIDDAKAEFFYSPHWYAGNRIDNFGVMLGPFVKIGGSKVDFYNTSGPRKGYMIGIQQDTPISALEKAFSGKATRIQVTEKTTGTAKAKENIAFVTADGKIFIPGETAKKNMREIYNNPKYAAVVYLNNGINNPIGLPVTERGKISVERNADGTVKKDGKMFLTPVNGQVVVNGKSFAVDAPVIVNLTGAGLDEARKDLEAYVVVYADGQTPVRLTEEDVSSAAKGGRDYRILQAQDVETDNVVPGAKAGEFVVTFSNGVQSTVTKDTQLQVGRDGVVRGTVHSNEKATKDYRVRLAAEVAALQKGGKVVQVAGPDGLVPTIVASGEASEAEQALGIMSESALVKRMANNAVESRPLQKGHLYGYYVDTNGNKRMDSKEDNVIWRSTRADKIVEAGNTLRPVMQLVLLDAPKTAPKMTNATHVTPTVNQFLKEHSLAVWNDGTVEFVGLDQLENPETRDFIRRNAFELQMQDAKGIRTGTVYLDLQPLASRQEVVDLKTGNTTIYPLFDYREKVKGEHADGFYHLDREHKAIGATMGVSENVIRGIDRDHVAGEKAVLKLYYEGRFASIEIFPQEKESSDGKLKAAKPLRVIDLLSQSITYNDGEGNASYRVRIAPENWSAARAHVQGLTHGQYYDHFYPEQVNREHRGIDMTLDGHFVKDVLTISRSTKNADGQTVVDYIEVMDRQAGEYALIGQIVSDEDGRKIDHFTGQAPLPANIGEGRTLLNSITGEKVFQKKDHYVYKSGLVGDFKRREVFERRDNEWIRTRTIDGLEDAEIGNNGIEYSRFTAVPEVAEAMRAWVKDKEKEKAVDAKTVLQVTPVETVEGVEIFDYRKQFDPLERKLLTVYKFNGEIVKISVSTEFDELTGEVRKAFTLNQNYELNEKLEYLTGETAQKLGQSNVAGEVLNPWAAQEYQKATGENLWDGLRREGIVPGAKVILIRSNQRLTNVDGTFSDQWGPDEYRVLRPNSDTRQPLAVVQGNGNVTINPWWSHSRLADLEAYKPFKDSTIPSPNIVPRTVRLHHNGKEHEVTVFDRFTTDAKGNVGMRYHAKQAEFLENATFDISTGRKMQEEFREDLSLIAKGINKLPGKPFFTSIKKFIYNPKSRVDVPVKAVDKEGREIIRNIGVEYDGDGNQTMTFEERHPVFKYWQKSMRYLDKYGEDRQAVPPIVHKSFLAIVLGLIGLFPAAVVGRALLTSRKRKEMAAKVRALPTGRLYDDQIAITAQQRFALKVTQSLREDPNIRRLDIKGDPESLFLFNLSALYVLGVSHYIKANNISPEQYNDVVKTDELKAWDQYAISVGRYLAEEIARSASQIVWNKGLAQVTGQMLEIASVSSKALSGSADVIDNIEKFKAKLGKGLKNQELADVLANEEIFAIVAAMQKVIKAYDDQENQVVADLKIPAAKKSEHLAVKAIRLTKERKIANLRKTLDGKVSAIAKSNEWVGQILLGLQVNKAVYAQIGRADQQIWDKMEAYLATQRDILALAFEEDLVKAESSTGGLEENRNMLKGGDFEKQRKAFGITNLADDQDGVEMFYRSFREFLKNNQFDEAPNRLFKTANSEIYIKDAQQLVGMAKAQNAKENGFDKKSVDKYVASLDKLSWRTFFGWGIKAVHPLLLDGTIMPRLVMAGIGLGALTLGAVSLTAWLATPVVLGVSAGALLLGAAVALGVGAFADYRNISRSRNLPLAARIGLIAVSVAAIGVLWGVAAPVSAGLFFLKASLTLPLVVEALSLTLWKRSSLGLNLYYYFRPSINPGRVRANVLVWVQYFSFMAISLTFGWVTYSWFATQLALGHGLNVALGLFMFTMTAYLTNFGLWMMGTFFASRFKPKDGAPAPSPLARELAGLKKNELFLVDYVGPLPGSIGVLNEHVPTQVEGWVNFEKGELVRQEDFPNAVRSGSGAVDRMIQGQKKEILDRQKQIQAQPENDGPDLFIKALNAILQNREFHRQIEGDRYGDILTDEMRALLMRAQNNDPSLNELDYARLNRALLMAVYPSEFKPYSFAERQQKRRDRVGGAVDAFLTELKWLVDDGSPAALWTLNGIREKAGVPANRDMHEFIEQDVRTWMKLLYMKESDARISLYTDDQLKARDEVHGPGDLAIPANLCIVYDSPEERQQLLFAKEINHIVGIMDPYKTKVNPYDGGVSLIGLAYMLRQTKDAQERSLGAKTMFLFTSNFPGDVADREGVDKFMKLFGHISGAEVDLNFARTVVGMKSGAMNAMYALPDGKDEYEASRIRAEKLSRVRRMLILDRNSNALDLRRHINDVVGGLNNPELAIMVAHRNTTNTRRYLGIQNYLVESGQGNSLLGFNEKIGTGWESNMGMYSWDTLMKLSNPDMPRKSFAKETLAANTNRARAKGFKGNYAQEFGAIGFSANGVGISEDYWAVIQQSQMLMALGYDPQYALTSSIHHKRRETFSNFELSSAVPRWSGGRNQTISSLMNQTINDIGPESYVEREAVRNTGRHYVGMPLGLVNLIMLPLSVLFGFNPFQGLWLGLALVGAGFNQVLRLHGWGAMIDDSGWLFGTARFFFYQSRDMAVFSVRVMMETLAFINSYLGLTFVFNVSGGGNITHSPDTQKLLKGNPWSFVSYKNILFVGALVAALMVFSTVAGLTIAHVMMMFLSMAWAMHLFIGLFVSESKPGIPVWNGKGDNIAAVSGVLTALGYAAWVYFQKSAILGLGVYGIAIFVLYKLATGYKWGKKEVKGNPKALRLVSQFNRYFVRAASGALLFALVPASTFVKFNIWPNVQWVLTTKQVLLGVGTFAGAILGFIGLGYSIGAWERKKVQKLYEKTVKDFWDRREDLDETQRVVIDQRLQQVNIFVDQMAYKRAGEALKEIREELAGRVSVPPVEMIGGGESTEGQEVSQEENSVDEGADQNIKPAQEGAEQKISDAPQDVVAPTSAGAEDLAKAKKAEEDAREQLAAAEREKALRAQEAETARQQEEQRAKDLKEAQEREDALRKQAETAVPPVVEEPVAEESAATPDAQEPAAEQPAADAPAPAVRQEGSVVTEPQPSADRIEASIQVEDQRIADLLQDRQSLLAKWKADEQALLKNQSGTPEWKKALQVVRRRISGLEGRTLPLLEKRLEFVRAKGYGVEDMKLRMRELRKLGKERSDDQNEEWRALNYLVRQARAVNVEEVEKVIEAATTIPIVQISQLNKKDVVDGLVRSNEEAGESIRFFAGLTRAQKIAALKAAIAQLKVENAILSAQLPVERPLNNIERLEAVLAEVEKPVGGIDLGDENLTINIQLDGSGMPLPANLQNPVLINLPGLSPVIRSIRPLGAANMPVISELLQMAGRSS